jgi:hypothetical protein
MDSLGYIFHELLDIAGENANNANDANDANDTNVEQTTNIISGLYSMMFNQSSDSDDSDDSDEFDAVLLNEAELKCATINAMRKYNQPVRVSYDEYRDCYILDIKHQIGTSFRTVKKMRDQFLCPINSESYYPHQGCACYFCSTPDVADADYIKFVEKCYDDMTRED